MKINSTKAVHNFCLFKGIYSRGKSHVLRLSVPIQLLLTEFEAIKEASLIKYSST